MKFITLLFIIWSTVSFSQTLSVKGKLYPSTETFELMRNTGFDEKLKLSIAKNNQQGLLILTVDIYNEARIIKAIMYLEDGTKIACLDKGIYDNVDQTTTSVFYLTKSEVEKLKHSNIYNIRFTLKDDWGYLENFSATNEQTILLGIVQTEKIDFTSIITELFNNH